MSRLSEDQKKIVREELSRHLATLHEIRSNTTGGPSGIVIPPSRVMKCTDNDSRTTVVYIHVTKCSSKGHHYSQLRKSRQSRGK